MKAVTNLTDDTVVLAGTEIASSSQETVREELISQDELSAISESGGKVTITQIVITVENAEEVTADDANTTNNDVDVKDNKDDANTTNNDVDSNAIVVAHVTFPKDVYTEKGNLSGSKENKETIAQLREKHGETILEDKDFSEKYPNEDVDKFRVEV